MDQLILDAALNDFEVISVTELIFQSSHRIGMGGTQGFRGDSEFFLRS